MTISSARRFGGDRLVLASHNEGKLAELGAMLAPLGVRVVGAGEAGLPAPEETGDSFEANASLKARAAADATGLPALDTYLATTPGGLYAVLAAAVGSGADATFVLSVQVLRLLVMLLAAPVLAKTLSRNR